VAFAAFFGLLAKPRLLGFETARARQSAPLDMAQGLGHYLKQRKRNHFSR